MKLAMRAHDNLRVQTLRGAIAAFTYELVSRGKKPAEDVDDDTAIFVLKRLAKQRKESAEAYRKGGRPELAEKELSELEIIDCYLPRMASRAEIDRVAFEKKKLLDVTDASGAGKLIGAVMKELGGNANGNEVKAAVAALF